ncbi:transcription-repair coupling factor [Pelistega europaea]|uniref:Transcription-repair-coupling factor n=1 Tax=Pelistega europaea TaxID=106147 RepID=A0A7Y4LAV0_9BURK|nr:transcription-repair coupling factor [Pelistega europaea]NOL50194.1 transcription-repair coupling factor [Pelistega europaea]
MSLIHLPSHAIKSGQKFLIARPVGSGDALWITQLADYTKKCLTVFCADPLEAQRLTEEMRLFASHLKIHQFPDWETLPYDAFSPHQDLISERLQTLNQLCQGLVDILVIPVTTALYRLAPPSFLAAFTFSFKKGATLDEQALKNQLMLANYTNVTQVTTSGEFSVRGSIIDIFPMGSALPYRLDLLDDEIDSIRAFDVDTQRSIYPVNEINLLPGREFPMDSEARQQFRARFREYFEGDPSRALPYKDVGNGISFAGIEYYLPLFFEQTATIFDYLPADSICITVGDGEKAIREFSEDTQNRYRFLNTDRERPILAPEELFLSQEQFYTALKSHPRLGFDDTQTSTDITTPPTVAVLRRHEQPFQHLSTVLNSHEWKVLLCTDSAGRRETLLQLLQEHQLRPSKVVDTIHQFLAIPEDFVMAVAPLQKGFALPEQKLLFITENDLYPESVSQSQRRRRQQEKHSNVDAMVRDLAELQEGDPIVHVQHGIGRYRGLTHMEINGDIVEMLQIDYAGDSKLYVPVSQLHVISRYSGVDPETAPLHKLGSGQWEKARKKAAKQVRDTAAELLHIYAQRALRQGYSFNLPLQDYEQFVAGFGFEETPDQAQAINAVIQDMTSDKPMDRLVCGDVGFGKTEVALRAAFLCIANGQQVVMLCPTTLLAEQHAQTFVNRFADWPVKIAELSRFRTGKETTATLKGLEDGTVDMVIGTHKVLSKDVHFKRLGLVIIDEEHRFGVRQKEALKALRSEVDILTLTATPIPRTLSMSLEGIRDFSVIATAPQKRLAIKTFVRREDNSTIREAVLRELKRGGQVYFLHNEVDTIYNRKARLEELIPEARIGVAHGQMHERELEVVMKDFYHQRCNILLCTTIIETGIDVPSANTIIIHRADKLGLAQLHQLRGRVGRSHHQAYAYLLTPGEDAITSQAKKRLEAIQSMEELGSGFYLAMHDLEIRGTGEVLGDQQSGNIQEVGFTLYADMLNRAVRALKAGKEPDLESPFDLGTEVNLHTSALLPDDYCPDINMRLSIYKRLSHAENNDDLIQIQEELVDRFGKLPEATIMLMATHRLRLIAQDLGITKIDISEENALLVFDEKNNKIDPVTIIELIQKNRGIRLQGPDKLRIELKNMPDIAQRIESIRQLLKTLKGK